MANQLIAAVAGLKGSVSESANGLTPLSTLDDAWVTHYGASFNGQALGCDATPYASDNASIVAVGPARDAEWPCGTIMRVCGPGGCIVAQRVDGCPGCGPYHIDLSEEGLLLVCGPGTGVCQANIEAFAPPCYVAPARDVEGRDRTALQLFATLAETALADRTADLLDLENAEVRTSVCSARNAAVP